MAIKQNRLNPARLALGTAALLLLGASPERPPAPETLAMASPLPVATVPEAETFAVAADRYSRMTVPVTIGDDGPFRFMIDTGSQATAITRDLGEQLALEPAGTATLVGMASRRTVDLVDLDGLGLGSMIFDNIEAPLLERRHVGADGIIGLDSLQDLRVMIDFRANSMAVVDRSASRDQRGFDIIVRARRQRNQLIITDALVDGVRASVIIDTGAQGTIGNLALRRRLRSRDQGETTMTDVNGVVLLGEVAVAKRLKIGDLELNNLAISYADTPAFAELGYANRPVLSLGMNHLRLFDRVSIDFNRRRLMFDLPSGSQRERNTVVDLQ